MVFVPYEFGAVLFQYIYPYVRPLGSLFLVGAGVMLAALMYPAWPPFVGRVGRAFMLAALAIYWWTVCVLPVGPTGTVLYLLMMAMFVMERRTLRRGQGLLLAFLSGVALCFGVLMAWAPQGFVRFAMAAMGAYVRWTGLLFFLLGAVLAVGLWRRKPLLCRLALGGLGLLFLNLTIGVASWRSWSGLGSYAVLALACALLVWGRRWPALEGVRWRLFRGMALASVLPIVAVGAVASYLAQKALEAELHGKAQQAVAAETAWLAQTASMASSLLRVYSQGPAFVAMVRAGNREGIQERLTLLESQSGLFDAAWLLDETGDTLMTSVRLNWVNGNFAYRSYFQDALKGGSQVLLSRPFLSRTNLPFVVFTVPMDLGAGRRAFLVAALSLKRLGLQPSLASPGYRVEIFDRRDGSLLRETERGNVLSRAPVLDLVGARALTRPEGLQEAFDDTGRRMVVAHAQVEGTPWTVVVTAQMREAFAPVTRMGGWVVAIAVLAGAIALVLSQWVGRDVAQRLESLRDGFAVLGTPSVEQRVPARGDDEIAQLTVGFNEMAARIDRTQKELREAIAIRDQFLSMASHELRTPLTPLKATLDLLIRQLGSGQGTNPERQRETIARLNRQVDRLTRLIGDMLDVSRLQSGRFTLTVAPMDVAALAREVVERIQVTRPERAEQLTLELPTVSLVGRWDEQRLDQLLTNLVENALRYSPPGAPVVVRVLEEDGQVRVEVEDRGIGIPEESVPQLFTPFFRARNATEHYAGGLGLGLAICREIVERHGGRIGVRSDGPGQGTCFTVNLPRAAIAEAA
ncbi:HAMP domain-containing protein [Corallococcus exercitus]|uniref:histidine kinase n=2 Tax=Corallococcus exercitus TaxID=2316736 RepID=A0A3A8IG71_9BACT|nr:ATP-binding protein [Corallococcus exercitus]NOK33440.1 HAMP domain-containing protein [Corallococcus exercitus]RKG76493.1 HAMP domain-containing protein [Corallococcus exercitus]